MKFKSEIVTQASGSIGGVTYSHNRGGMYRRARAIPTNPNSVGQQDVRMYLGAAAAAWSNTLTAAQRLAWENYANLTPITDALGDPLVLTGQQMYIRSAVMRQRAGAELFHDGPTTPGLAELTAVSVTDAAGSVDVNFTNTDGWAGSEDAVLAIQTSRNLPLATNYFKGPFRFLAAVPGDSVTPPTSPFTFNTNAFGEATATSRIAVRIVASDAESRLSPVFTGLVTTTV